MILMILMISRFQGRGDKRFRGRRQDDFGVGDKNHDWINKK